MFICPHAFDDNCTLVSQTMYLVIVGARSIIREPLTPRRVESAAKPFLTRASSPSTKFTGLQVGCNYQCLRARIIYLSWKDGLINKCASPAA